MARKSEKIFATTILLFSIVTNAFGGGYSDAVAKEKICSDYGDSAVKMYEDSQKAKNPFDFSLKRQETANKYLKKAYQETVNNDAADAATDSIMAELIGYDPTSKKDAYMHTWAKCMESRRPRPDPDVPLAASTMIPFVSTAPARTKGARARAPAVT